MSDVTTHSATTAAARAIGRFATPVLEAVERVAKLFTNRRAVAQLAILDAHMLRDIGLTEADIVRAVETPLGEDPTEVLARAVRERREAHAAQRREAMTAL